MCSRRRESRRVFEIGGGPGIAREFVTTWLSHNGHGDGRALSWEGRLSRLRYSPVSYLELAAFSAGWGRLALARAGNDIIASALALLAPCLSRGRPGVASPEVGAANASCHILEACFFFWFLQAQPRPNTSSTRESPSRQSRSLNSLKTRQTLQAIQKYKKKGQVACEYHFSSYHCGSLCPSLFRRTAARFHGPPMRRSAELLDTADQGPVLSCLPQGRAGRPAPVLSTAAW